MKKVYLLSSFGFIAILLSLPSFRTIDFQVAIEPARLSLTEADYGFTAFTTSFITTRGTQDPPKPRMSYAYQAMVLAAYE